MSLFPNSNQQERQRCPTAVRVEACSEAVPRVAVVALLGILLSASLAHAARITVFTERDYRGESRTYDGPVGNLASEGIDEQLSSVRIESGTWQLCRQRGFGECIAFDAREGSIAHLLAWNIEDDVSSLRPIGDSLSEVPTTTAPSGGGDASLVLYEDYNFTGREKVYTAAVPNLKYVNFNDAASSLRVERGRWEICRASDYRECQVFGPRDGALSDLRRYNLNDEVSSLRPVGGNTGSRPPSTPAGGAAITVYDDFDYGGRSEQLTTRIDDLASSGWAGAASSLRVDSGVWEICRQRGLRECAVFDRASGALSNLRTFNMNDNIASLRPVELTAPRAAQLPASSRPSRPSTQSPQSYNNRQAAFVVESMYQGILGRGAEEAAVRNGSVQVLQGRVDEFAAGVTRSEEFQNLAARTNSRQLLDQMTSGFLGRKASGAEVSAYMQRLQRRDYTSVVRDLMASDEFRSRVQSMR